MRTVGLSVPDVVREIITRNRSIHDCMAMDVINYTALAVKIHPEVEKQIGNPIHLNTIVVAIKRYADAFEKDENVIAEPVLKDARLSMTDRIMGMQWTMKDILDQDIARMLGEAEKALTNSEFFRLGDSLRILADDSDVTRRIFQNFPKENVYSSGLAKIRIQVPEQNRADVVSYETEILHPDSTEPNSSPASISSSIVGSYAKTMSPNAFCAWSVIPISAFPPSIIIHSWSRV